MQVKVVRMYLSEHATVLKELYDYLHDEKIQGATLFRGVKGFGNTGVSREATLLDWHVDLPMVVEFFDAPEKIDAVFEHFKEKLNASHVLSWTADMGF